MRKLAVAMALASTALVATPALARDNAWYVGVEGGAMIVEDIKFDIGAVRQGGTVDHNYGYDVDGVIGYDLGRFRLEAEVGYKAATMDSYRTTVTTPVLNSLGRPAGVNPGTFDYVGGRSSALSFMVNGLVDFGDDDGIQGFVGGGVGVARVKERAQLNTRQNFLDDSDTVFAYQGLAGVRAPITKHIDASLKYRFFTADNVKLVNVAGTSFNGKFRTHSLLGGLTYNFGEPAAPPPPPVVEAPPPPPVEPTPPPPPVATPCSPGPFIVFFEWDKSDVTPEAAAILDGAVAQYQNCGSASVMLAGHADKSGAPAYNVGLSQRRNESVQAYLAAHSIPAGVITSEAFGESRPRVETADGVREVQNRRVEVTYGPGSGN
ncbi:OmpA family protein [Sphingomonas sp. HMP6]|uniref:OmpA family protein n=1 Tax=Sphingomonas sp. HMP6 TaxID=1517551 RepID=UPI001E4290FD|nr:OmpA family protein [Sphingomonas sp. HMP6]